MPELPEVETTIQGLRKKVLGRAFFDIWTDAPKIIKKPLSFEKFRREIKGRKIKKIWRRGKNIIFDLSGGFSLLVHQKLTGHLLYGRWKKNKKGQWQAEKGTPLENDPMNRFLHLIFFLDNKSQIALSDLRKFAKVELWQTKDLINSKQFKELGPDALSKSLTLNQFKARLKDKGGKIKQVLMDQRIIAGIGNIYSDEILFAANVNPFGKTSKLSSEELKKIYLAMKRILKKAIELKGTSVSDYRIPTGEKGRFGEVIKVYRRAKEKCLRCGAEIKRIKLGGRSAHFCPKCQT